MHNNVPFVFLWVLLAAAARRIVDIHCHFTSLLEMLLLRVICWESYHKHHLLAMMVFSREKPCSKSFTLTIDLNILTSCDHSHWSSNIHPCLDVPPWHLESVSCTHPHECDTWALWEKDSSLTPATLEHDILIMQVLVRMRWWSNGQREWADFNWFLSGAPKNPKKWPPPLTFSYHSYYQTVPWHLQLLLKKVAGSPSEPEIKCPQTGLVVLSNQQGTFFARVNGIILHHLSPKFQNCWAFWRDSGFRQQQKTTSAWFHFSRWHESPTV